VPSCSTEGALSISAIWSCPQYPISSMSFDNPSPETVDLHALAKSVEDAPEVVSWLNSILDEGIPGQRGGRSLDETDRMINGKPGPEDYAAVIPTVPLPRLSLMDLTGVNANGNYGQWSAIREPQYGPAIKVGLKFSCPWWQTELPQLIIGGQSFTDLPLRTM